MTAHADICSRLDKALCCQNCPNIGYTARQISDYEWEPEQCEFCYTEPNSRFNIVNEIIKEQAALIQQMAGELEYRDKVKGTFCDSCAHWEQHAYEQNKRAESAESELADMRAKLAAAEAGFPSYPLPHYLASDYESAWISKNDYDSMRDFATAQAVRIAEVDSDRALLDSMQKMTEGYGNGWIFRRSETGRGWRLHETSRDGAHLNIRDAIKAALQLAAKRD